MITIFVDHCSDLKYIHFMTSVTSQEILYAKECFERVCFWHNVFVEHYHCDNGRFADEAFIDDITKKGQTISYCAAYAHFQNGKAEKAIQDVQDMARTMLLHAKARWPDAIHLSLWPYAMRMAIHIMNHLPDEADGSSRIEKFSRVEVQAKMQHFHTFGCPVYALTPEAENAKAKK